MKPSQTQSGESDSLADRLEACYSGAVYDVLRKMGHPHCVLPSEICPLDRSQRVAGPIFTVTGRRAPGLDDHATLLAWTEMLSAVPRGSVVVCQPNDHTLAHMGELSAETLQLRGVRGYVVDGGCRDVDFIEQNHFPVFCRYTTPADIVGKWSVIGMQEPIAIGEVTITAGDYVLAARDGVIIIPERIAAEVVQQAEEVMQTENLVRRAIQNNMDPKSAYLKYGKF